MLLPVVSPVLLTPAGVVMNTEPALQLSRQTCSLLPMPRPTAGVQSRLALAGTRSTGQLTSSADREIQKHTLKPTNGSRWQFEHFCVSFILANRARLRLHAANTWHKSLTYSLSIVTSTTCRCRCCCCYGAVPSLMTSATIRCQSHSVLWNPDKLCSVC